MKLPELLRNLTIKQKVVVGVLLVYIAGVLFANIFIFVRVVTLIEEGIIHQARAICVMGEAIREYQAENWSRGLYDREELKKDVQGKFVYAVPVFSSIMTMKKKAEELGYTFRVPKIQPRNAANEPDAFEKGVLDEMNSGNKKELVKVEWEKERVVYFRAVRLTSDCLACHGDPATSKELWGNDEGKDPTGARMEGWKAGEVHGAFEITYDLKRVLTENNKTKAAGLFINLILVFIAVLIIRRIVRKSLMPLDEMQVSLAQINAGAGDLTVQIPVRGDDEVGKVAQQFNAFIGHMRGIVAKIGDSASHVSC